jgi:hypothetical protein
VRPGSPEDSDFDDGWGQGPTQPKSVASSRLCCPLLAAAIAIFPHQISIRHLGLTAVRELDFWLLLLGNLLLCGVMGMFR